MFLRRTHASGSHRSSARKDAGISRAGWSNRLSGTARCVHGSSDDRFRAITEHPAAELLYDRNYLGIHRTDDCIFVQITLSAGRTVEMKQRFYKAVADGLHESLKLRREDVFINLVEVPKENWSFGNGEAQYVSATPK